MTVLFWVWSWNYLKLLPSTLLIHWLLLSSPLLLVVKIPLHSVEFNHSRSCRGKKKKEDIFSDAAGRQREGQHYLPPGNLQAGFGLSQVPQAFSIPWDTPSTRHYLSTTAFALWLWVTSPKGDGEESQTKPRKDPRMLYCRSVRKAEVIV